MSRAVTLLCAMAAALSAVSTNPSAQTPSIALHRPAGFRPVGTLEAVGFKHGRWLDTVLMQRPLGDGGASPP